MSQRAKNEGRIYLRRSTTRQDASMPMQLQWGIAQAAVHGVRLDASQDDLDHMLSQGMQEYKGIFLDDGITGSNLDRPGFLAFRNAAITDRRISHVFIHMSDRFARPELAVQAMQLEIGILLAGVTAVFSNRVSRPRQLGNSYFADDMQLLYEYSQNGEFLTKLSQRVLESQIGLAKSGFWRGGTPPYGFARVLVNAAGLEVRILEEGETVKIEGCHVRIKPHDQEKIRVWLLILHLHGELGWGHKRIANYLNYQLKIPSPNAGKLITRNGKASVCSGKWRGQVVGRLIGNEAILGLCAFGKTAAGKHRRFGAEGPRLLETEDRKETGEAKVIAGPIEQRIVAETGYAPSVDKELFQKCQELTEERGKRQRGIPRAQDIGKYPLSGMITDLTENCGATLYGRTEDAKQKYVCSRYVNSGGHECERNTVEDSKALQFVLGVLRQRTVQCGGREKLREKLKRIAGAQNSERGSIRDEERVILQQRIDQVRLELNTIEGNLALAKSPASFAAIEKQFGLKNTELEQLQLTLDSLPPTSSLSQSSNCLEEEVNAAMALFEDLCNISDNTNARSEIYSVFKRIELRLGLKFIDNPKGKRPKRIVQGGLLTIGPNQTFLADEVRGGDHPPCADGGIGDLESHNAGKNLLTAKDRQHKVQSFRKDTSGKPDSTTRCSKRQIPNNLSWQSGCSSADFACLHRGHLAIIRAYSRRGSSPLQ